MQKLLGRRAWRWPFFLVASAALAAAAIMVAVSAPPSETLVNVSHTMGTVGVWGFHASKGDTIRLSFRAERPVHVSLYYLDEDNPPSRLYLGWPQVTEMEAVVEIREQHDTWLVFIRQPPTPVLVPLSYDLKVERVGVPPPWAWSAIGLQLASVLVCSAGAASAMRGWQTRRSRSDVAGGDPS